MKLIPRRKIADESEILIQNATEVAQTNITNYPYSAHSGRFYFRLQIPVGTDKFDSGETSFIWIE